MKVLATNSNYSTSHQNCKKKDVNFEAVKVIGPYAVKKFDNIAPASSLPQHLVIWANSYLIGRPFGRKLEAVIRTATGIPNEVPLKQVFDLKTGNYSNIEKIQSDLFLFSEDVGKKGEFVEFKAQLAKAEKEVEREFYRPKDEYDKSKQVNQSGLEGEARNTLIIDLNTGVKVSILEKFWDTEGTECNKLGKMIKDFMTDADKEGHQVTNKEITAFEKRFEANKTERDNALVEANRKKGLADQAITDEMIAKWFA